MYLEPILYGLRYVFLPMRRGLTPFMGRSRWWSVIIWGASLSRLTCRKPRLSTFPELPLKWKPNRELLVMSPCPMAIVSVGPILLKLRSKWTSDWFSLMASPRFFPTVPGYRCPWPSPFQQRSITLSFGFCLKIWATLAAPGPEILFQPRYNSAMFEIPSHLSNSHAICLIPESVIWFLDRFSLVRLVLGIDSNPIHKVSIWLSFIPFWARFKSCKWNLSLSNRLASSLMKSLPLPS